MAITLERNGEELVVHDPVGGRRVGCIVVALIGLAFAFWGLASEWHSNGLAIVVGVVFFLAGAVAFFTASARKITLDVRVGTANVESVSMVKKKHESYRLNAFKSVELGYVAGEDGGSGYNLELVPDKEDEEVESILLNENSGPMTSWFGGRTRLIAIGEEVADYLGIPFRWVKLTGANKEQL